MKYDSPKNEGEILPNKLGITDPLQIQKEVVIPDKLPPHSGGSWPPIPEQSDPGVSLLRNNQEEYRGFLRAELKYESEIIRINQFDWDFISSIHITALAHLYEFAGQLRQVNISKGGFLFPAAQHLDSAIKTFEQDFLKSIPSKINDKAELIELLLQCMPNSCSYTRFGKGMAELPDYF